MPANPYGFAALFGQGDHVIKAVAILLLLMSISSWYVIVVRTWRALGARHAAQRAGRFWQASSYAQGLHELGGDAGRNPFRHVAEQGQAAIEHHAARQSGLQVQLGRAEWLTESLRGAIDEAAERYQGGLALLASVGATAPFVGLFGTVWGIYHALVSIGVAGQANIGQIAGPVGESLIMTACGLAVAIPAVLGYNALTRANKTLLGKLHRFARQLHAYFLTGAPLGGSTGKQE